MFKKLIKHVLIVGFIFSGYVKAQNADSVITTAGTMDVYYDLTTVTKLLLIVRLGILDCQPVG